MKALNNAARLIALIALVMSIVSVVAHWNHHDCTPRLRETHWSCN